MSALQSETIDPIDLRANPSNDGVWHLEYGYCQSVLPHWLDAPVNLLGAGV